MTSKIRRFSLLVLSLAGMLTLFLGSFIITSEKFKMISGLCIGLGSIMLVSGIGYLLKSYILSPMEDEKIKRIIDIEVNDERNIRIKEKAGYMVSRIMNYMISILVLALGFMNVDKIILIMVALLLLSEFVLFISFLNYYSKRM